MKHGLPHLQPHDLHQYTYENHFGEYNPLWFPNPHPALESKLPMMLPSQIKIGLL